MRTRKQFADAIHLAMGGPRLQPLSRSENLVLTTIAYFQPVTRGELSQLFGKEVSRDVIGQLRALNFIAAGPRSPQPGARGHRPRHGSCCGSRSVGRMIGSDTPHQRARVIDRQPAEDDLTQRLQAAISSD